MNRYAVVVESRYSLYTRIVEAESRFDLLVELYHDALLPDSCEIKVFRLVVPDETLDMKKDVEPIVIGDRDG